MYMVTQKLVEHIRKFVPLGNIEQGIIERYTKHISLEQYSYLLQKGEINSSIYFVEKGCLRMFFEKTKSIELTTQFAIEGWWLADFFSFIDNTPSEYFIQALEQSEIISVDKTMYHELLKEIPQLNKYFGIIMQKNIAASQLRIKYLYEMSPRRFTSTFYKVIPRFR